MSTVKVSQPYDGDAAAARGKLGDFQELLERYKVGLDWKGDTQAKIKGTGVSGGVTLGSDAVEVVVKLGMLAKAVGVDPKRLESSIRKRLSAAFDG